MRVSPRKRLSGEERRAAILDSALAVFAERGYHASSIDDIAREGGISKALIYEHFASKQQAGDEGVALAVVLLLVGIALLFTSLR